MTQGPARIRIPTPSLVADEVIAPDSRTERLNTKAAGVIGLAVMCSRVLGLAREQICAALFGGGGAMDAFTAAFRIPNLLRDLFAEGALSTAFVTTFSKTIAREGDAAAWRLANKVATLTVLVLGALCVLGMVFSRAARRRCSRRDSIRRRRRCTALLTRIMFPFILLVSLAALVMGMLNAKSVFGMPAMASSFFNIGSIVGGVALGCWIDPHVRSARADRPRHRHADRRRAAARGAAAAAAPAGLPLPARLSTGAIAGVDCHPAADGAVGHRGEHDAVQRAGQLHVRLDARRRRDLLARRSRFG